jgi:hypothetical protein
MPDVATVSGRLSGFALSKQSGAGTQAAATNRLNNSTFDFTEAFNKVIFETLNGTLDAENEVRTGVLELMGKASWPSFLNQGVPIIKAGIGQSIDSAAAINMTALSGNTAIGDTSFTVAGPVPAIITGTYDFTGQWVDIGTGAGQESVPILGRAGTTFYTWKMKKAHTAADAVSLVRSVTFTPNGGSNKGVLDYLSLYLQYGNLFERQFIDVQVESLNLKGGDERLDFEASFVTNQPIYYEGTSLTSIPSGTGEASDSPIIMRDGGLFTYWAAGDTYPKNHNRLKSLDWGLQYAFQKDKVGGGETTTMLHTVSKRTLSLSWSELAGSNGATNTIRQDFGEGANETPAILAFRNPKTGFCISVVMPRCNVTQFDAVGPSDNPIAYQGQIKPLRDFANSDMVCKVIVRNGVYAY